MEPVTTRVRAELDEGRAALMRRAADLIGSERLAKMLGVSARTVYWWMSGKRTVKDAMITVVRQMLIEQRQAIADLLSDFREEEEAAACQEPSQEQKDAAKAAMRQMLTSKQP
jgi:transcriptional regulator with XRE-family HTH domain